MASGSIVNYSNKTLWVVETDSGSAVAHKLEPNLRSPRGLDADGVKAVDGTKISNHGSWWKFRVHEVEILDDANALRINRCLFPFCESVDEDEFGNVTFDQSPGWGEPILPPPPFRLDKNTGAIQMLAGSDILSLIENEVCRDFELDPGLREELALEEIPSTINDVTIEFAATVNKNVEKDMVDGLKHCIKKAIASGHTLTKIWISSANDSHSLPSRHAQAKAVDISRINGKKLSVHYNSDATVKAIVNAIQDTFESFGERRENFGPHFKKKLGQPYDVAGHEDHIHLSVN